MKMTCHACGMINDLPDRVGFRDVCSSCDAWLHACVNCRFWSDGRCVEPSAEKVGDPEGQNYCEWFRERAQDSGRGAQDKPEDTRTTAEEMWRKLTKK